MRPIESDITNLLQSRLVTWLLCILAVVMLWSGVSFGTHPGESVNSSLSGMMPVILGGNISTAAVDSFILLVCSGIMALTDSSFNILRASSRLNIGLFALMACATPSAMGYQLTGALLCVTILLCMMIMYTTYYRTSATRRIFLVFCLISAGSVIQYSFAVFIPVMLLGCWQMRCLTFRSFLAAVIGLITPYWILWGFGIISLEQLSWPQFELPSPDVVISFSPAQLVAFVFASVVTLVAVASNLVQMMGRNARTRAFNGLLASIAFWTVLMALIDFGHFLSYMPLLCALSAMQLTLLFVNNEQKRMYVMVLLAIFVFVAVYLWNMLV